MIYRFKDAAHLPRGLDAQAVGETLDAIRETEGSGFTPESVVHAARSKRSPLHAAFTWDDGEAAEKYRLTEASYLIRTVVVVVHDDERGEDREERAFVPVTVRDADESRYLPIVDVISDDDYRRQHAERLLSELIAVRRRGQDFKEFARVWTAIDAAAKRFAA